MTVDGVTWPLFEGIPVEDRDRFLAIALRSRFDAGDVVVREGRRAESMHLVAEGRFSVRVGTANGDQAMLTVLGPGASFGELGLLTHGRTRTATVTALGPAETIVVGSAEFEQLRLRFPSVDRVLVNALAHRVEELSALLVQGLYSPVEVRVLARLLDAARVWGGTVVSLTQQDVAELAGTTRPSANRALRLAEAEGLIRLRRGRVELLDLDGMARRVMAASR